MNKAPAIIPPEHIIESVSHTGIEGWFEIELIHKPTGLVKQKLRFKNLITNAGLEWIGTPGGSSTGVAGIFGNAGWAAVGSGTTVPTVNDIALQSQVGARTQSKGSPEIPVVAGSGGTEFDYWFYRTTKVFLPGVATSNSLTEVGIFSASSGGTMWCRQLFRDNNGDPITIVKTSDDELRVIYELRVYPMKVSNTTTATIKSVERTCTTRGYDIDAVNRWGETNAGGISLLLQLGRSWSATLTGEGHAIYSSTSMPALTATQSGSATGPSSGAWGSYSSNTYYRDASYTFNPGLGTLTIGSIVWGGNTSGWNVPFITTFDTSFTKTSTERFTFTGRLSWGRV